MDAQKRRHTPVLTVCYGRHLERERASLEACTSVRSLIALIYPCLDDWRIAVSALKALVNRQAKIDERGRTVVPPSLLTRSLTVASATCRSSHPSCLPPKLPLGDWVYSEHLTLPKGKASPHKKTRGTVRSNTT